MSIAVIISSICCLLELSRNECCLGQGKIFTATRLCTKTSVVLWYALRATRELGPDRRPESAASSAAVSKDTPFAPNTVCGLTHHGSSIKWLRADFLRW